MHVGEEELALAPELFRGGGALQLLLERTHAPPFAGPYFLQFGADLGAVGAVAAKLLLRAEVARGCIGDGADLFQRSPVGFKVGQCVGREVQGATAARFASGPGDGGLPLAALM